jgi:uncharacterized protein with HEPN domain
MQPDGRDEAYLLDMYRHALEAAEFASGRTIDDFRSDLMLRRAVERAIEIVGEAARRISPEFQDQHTSIPWRRIAGLRNILAHQYGDVVPERFWSIVTEGVPELIDQLSSVLDVLDEDD